MSLHHAFLCQSFNWRPEFLAKIFHFYYYQTRQTINFIISFNYISFMNSITRYYLMNIFMNFTIKQKIHENKKTSRSRMSPTAQKPWIINLIWFVIPCKTVEDWISRIFVSRAEFSFRKVILILMLLWPIKHKKKKELEKK